MVLLKSGLQHLNPQLLTISCSWLSHLNIMLGFLNERVRR